MACWGLLTDDGIALRRLARQIRKGQKGGILRFPLSPGPASFPATWGRLVDGLMISSPLMPPLVAPPAAGAPADAVAYS
jgi:hypothetical protein